MTEKCVFPECRAKKKVRSHFKFPAENKELLKRWLDALKFLNINQKKIEKYFLCEDHFKKDEIIQEAGERVLKENTVPSIFFDNTPGNKICRLCLVSVKPRHQVVVDDYIKVLFEEVTNTNFPDFSDFSGIACKSCCTELFQCSRSRKKFVARQRRLEIMLGQSKEVKKEMNPKLKEIKKEVEKEVNQELNDAEVEMDFSDYYGEIRQETSEDTKNAEMTSTGERSNEYLRRRHRYYKPNEERVPFECDICGFQSQEMTTLFRHIKVHLKNNKFRCETCKMGFVSRDLFLDHRQNIHPRTFQWICDICAKSFNYIKNFENHMAKHSGNKPFVCDEENCGKAFYAREHLTNHKNKVHREPTICEICSERTKDIARHMQRHTGYRFECNFILENGKPCGKKFVSNWRLKVHTGIHNGIRKYVCKYCSISYKYYSALYTHIRTNHLHFKIKCNVPGCNSEFVRKENLRGHIKSVHKNLSASEMEEMFAEIREAPLPKVDTMET